MKRMRVILRRVLRAIADVGPRESHFYLGLAIAGAGGVAIAPAWTFVALGTVVAAVGYWGTRS